MPSKPVGKPTQAQASAKTKAKAKATSTPSGASNEDARHSCGKESTLNEEDEASASQAPIQAGVFRPGAIQSLEALIELFAIAARAAAAKPENMRLIQSRLQAVCEPLVHPERAAAGLFFAVWEAFVRRAQTDGRIEVHGKQLCSELEIAGQQVDLPPLPAWELIPEGIEADKPFQFDEESRMSAGEALGTILQEARPYANKIDKKNPFPYTLAASMLVRLDATERSALFVGLVQGGILGRGEASMLVRHLVKGGKVRAQDTTLVEVLRRLGAWLATTPIEHIHATSKNGGTP